VVALSGELFDAIEINAARTGNHKRAATRMSRLAVQASPGGMSRAEAHLRAGEQWLLADEPAAAADEFRAAIADAGPSLDDPRVPLARAMFELDRPAEADALLGELAQSGGRSLPRTCSLVAELLTEQGDLTGALSWATAGVDACLRGDDRDELQLLLGLRYRIRVDLGLPEDDYDKMLDKGKAGFNRIVSSEPSAFPDEPMEGRPGRGRETLTRLLSPSSRQSGVREVPRELQMRIDRLADIIWDQLSPDAQNSLEELATEIMESR
jgi:hypothetical protein